LKALLAKAGYDTELTTDDEHGLWEIKTFTASGNGVIIDWNFASYVEFHKALELYTTLEDRLAAPFTVGENGTKEEVATREELLEKYGCGQEGLNDSTLQRSGRDESRTALGNNYESREANSPASENRRRS